MLNAKARAAVELAKWYAADDHHDSTCPCPCDEPCARGVEVREKLEVALNDYNAITEEPGVEREHLPNHRKSYTQEMKCAGHKVYIGVGMYEDGRAAELFIDMKKDGETMRGVFNSLAIAASLALQYGAPVQELVDAFVGMKFQPHGPVQCHDQIGETSSLPSLIFHDIGLEFGAYIPPEAQLFEIEEEKAA